MPLGYIKPRLNTSKFFFSQDRKAECCSLRDHATSRVKPRRFMTLSTYSGSWRLTWWKPLCPGVPQLSTTPLPATLATLSSATSSNWGGMCSITSTIITQSYVGSQYCGRVRSAKSTWNECCSDRVFKFQCVINEIPFSRSYSITLRLLQEN